jgi:cytochrome c-type biogenesis protein CcmH
VRALASVVLACAFLLVAKAAAQGAAPQTSLSDIEEEVMCPTCGTALSLSESPLADRMRAFIQRLVDDGKSKDEIKRRLVIEFGPDVLASPPREGFTLAAYLVPVAGLGLAALAVALALRPRRRPSRADPPPAADDFEELVDADLASFRAPEPAE